MKKKKILITISSLKIGGGAERVASTLGTELQNKDYEVHYLTFYKHTNNYEFEGKNHYCLDEKLRTGIISKGFKLFNRAKEIAKYCKKHKIDTSISFMEEANFPLVISKYFGNKSKIIISIHNDPDRLFSKNSIEELLMKATYPKANLSVGVSNKIISKLQKYKLKKTKKIYNINDITKFTEKSKKTLSNEMTKLYKNKFVFITVGRLAEQKGHNHLIKAFNEINNKNKLLLILGEGKKRKELEELIDTLQLQEKVILMGNINNVYPYIKQSDCFVLSSNHEGFGLTIVEALSLNKPVISTDCEVGPREILSPSINIDKKIKYPHYGEYGILTKPFGKNPRKQEEQLAEVMAEIMDDKELRKKYSNGLERAKDFDKNTIIKEWEKVI